MDNYGLIFHHIGLAVSNTDRTMLFLKGLGYNVGESVYDPLQNVNLIMCRHQFMPNIELVFSSGNSGPVDNIISTDGERIYHIGYESNCCEESLRAMKKEGIRVINVSPPKIAVLFEGKKVSFYFVKGFGLIEIIEP